MGRVNLNIISTSPYGSNPLSSSVSSRRFKTVIFSTSFRMVHCAGLNRRQAVAVRTLTHLSSVTCSFGFSTSKVIGLLCCPAQLNLCDSRVRDCFGKEQQITRSNHDRILFQLFDFCITFDSEVSVFQWPYVNTNIMSGSLDMGEKVGDREDSLCHFSLCADCVCRYVLVL